MVSAAGANRLYDTRRRAYAASMKVSKLVPLAVWALSPFAAAEVHPATWLAASSSADVFNGATPDGMLDGSGLSAPLSARPGAPLSALLGVTHQFDLGYLQSWVTNGVAGDYYASKPPPVLVFDLGAEVWLSSLVFWQYQNDGGGFGRSGNAAKTIRLRFSGGAQGPVFSGPAWGSVGLANVHLHLRGVNSAQHVPLGAGVAARYVEMTVTDNYFGEPGIVAGGDRVGLGEVRFNVASGGGRTAVAGAPSAFELRAASSAVPQLTSVLSGINPWGLALDPDGERVIWSDPTSGSIGWTGYGANASGAGVVLPPDPNRVPHGIDIDCAGGVLYALDSTTDALLRVDLATSAVASILPGLFQRPNAVDFDPDDGLVAVADSGHDTLYLIDPVAGAVVASWANAQSVGAWGVACDPASEAVYYSSHDLGAVFRWNPAGSVSQVVSGLAGPRGLEFDRHGQLYVLESGTGALLKIDVAAGTATPTPVGVAPGGRDLLVFDGLDADGDALLDWWERAEGFPLCALGAAGDPDFDGVTAFAEMLFHGSAQAGREDEIGTRLAAIDGGGSFGFESLAAEGYAFRLMISDDLSTWREASAPAVLGAVAGGYQSRTYEIDPLAEGFPADARIFGRLDGTLIAP